MCELCDLANEVIATQSAEVSEAYLTTVDKAITVFNEWEDENADLLDLIEPHIDALTELDGNHVVRKALGVVAPAVAINMITYKYLGKPSQECTAFIDLAMAVSYAAGHRDGSNGVAFGEVV